MNPNGSTSPVPSVSTATVDSRSLPSRGRSFQNDARDGRSRAGEVTGPSMAKATDSPQTLFLGQRPFLAHPAGRLVKPLAEPVSLGVSATCAIVACPHVGQRPTYEQEVGCANRQGQVVRRREGLRFSQRRRGH